MARCNLCGGTQWETLEEVGTTKVVRCTCGLVFVTPPPSMGHLKDNYDDHYYRAWEQQNRHRERIWKHRLMQVSRNVPPPGKLLDVGCGTGEFLRLARKQGWEIAGTEFSRAGSSEVKTSGIPVWEGEIWEASLPENAFDVVTCWHVIEHVTDPRRVLQECFRILRPGGWLFLATPNVHDHMFRAAYVMSRGRRPSLYEPNEREIHLYFFSAQTLRNMVRQAFFEVQRVGFDQGAAAESGKRLVDALAYVWYRCTGIHWGMALELWARKPLGYEGTC